MNETSVSALKDELQICISTTQKLDEQLTDTASQEYQDRVKSTIRLLEQITVRISQLDVFSANETLDELCTSHIRFLMLPAMLACLTDKLADVDRRINLDRVEIYIKDFMGRLKNYDILPSTSSWFATATVDSTSQQTSTPEDYVKNAIKERSGKVQLFREQQEFKEKYNRLTEICADCQDEDRLREFYLVELNYWARKLYELLCNIQREKSILDHMAKLKSGEIKPDALENRPPVKPLILTRTKLQKDVFGLGYPSVPTMTVEDFFDQKRTEGQIQPLQKAPGTVTEEDEKIEKEKARENEDSELIRSERGFDEYKDAHRRGWGNTHNIG